MSFSGSVVLVLARHPMRCTGPLQAPCCFWRVKQLLKLLELQQAAICIPHCQLDKPLRSTSAISGLDNRCYVQSRIFLPDLNLAVTVPDSHLAPSNLDHHSTLLIALTSAQPQVYLLFTLISCSKAA